ncbi:Lanosterol synthase (Oxidosqualene--lanosterol cyclase) [Physocladia obscura]|uniref:lanosterol synthase n=1 Tax=Physocladia obscura TaxID=109957 RepID=A0AAD5T7U6_9FUNG|nr:Lanosterol synthase (Oxidosqualene--lanosterol cyclase) [Physocladia obscura]
MPTINPPLASASTDATKWRLAVCEGRQTWHYLGDNIHQLSAWKQTDYDRYWQGLPLENQQIFAQPETPLDAATNGYRFFERLQTEDGHWAGEYGGPMFLIPGLVITMYITKTPWKPGQVIEIANYLRARAHKVDGGWGIHIEGVSTVFGTALNYVALRLLGVHQDDPVCVKARACLHKFGGAVGIPSWGKFWLSVLNVYEWEGNNPIPPELWLLPYWVPIHPGRMWCHSRQVSIPMSYLYGSRFKANLDPLLLSLRKELYLQPYETIKWSLMRNNVAKVDLFLPHTKLMDICNEILFLYEKSPIKFIRDRALKTTLDQIKYEDINTDYLDLGPVNKAMNMLAIWVSDGPESKSFKNHQRRIDDFLWKTSEGLLMNGTNGSQLWDLAFCVQAIVETGLAQAPEFKKSLLKAYGFLDITQIRRNTLIDPQTCHRHISKGAWPFSTRDQSYTVSDCTAEGLKATLLLQNKVEFPANYNLTKINDDRLFDAVNVLLSMQNGDGGFASYELVRGPEWFEWLNPAEVFGKIMVEYTYPECTTSVVLGLAEFREHYPTHRRAEIDSTIARAVKYILKVQRKDGSWYGSWGICFTYAGLFALNSLSSVGLKYHNSEPVRRACEFLISKQKEDGGWGESFKSSETYEYVQHEKSQVVHTSWALLGLMAAEYPVQGNLAKGIKLIMSRQQPNGEWLQEAIEGVFNHNCYPNYKFIFTIWALGTYNNNVEINFMSGNTNCVIDQFMVFSYTRLHSNDGSWTRVAAAKLVLRIDNKRSAVELRAFVESDSFDVSATGVVLELVPFARLSALAKDALIGFKYANVPTVASESQSNTNLNTSQRSSKKSRFQVAFASAYEATQCLSSLATLGVRTKAIGETAVLSLQESNSNSVSIATKELLSNIVETSSIIHPIEVAESDDSTTHPPSDVLAVQSHTTHAAVSADFDATDPFKFLKRPTPASTPVKLAPQLISINTSADPALENTPFPSMKCSSLIYLAKGDCRPVSPIQAISKKSYDVSIPFESMSKNKQQDAFRKIMQEPDFLGMVQVASSMLIERMLLE